MPSKRAVFSHFRDLIYMSLIASCTGWTVCVRCDSLERCPTGQFRSGCGDKSEGVCKPCTKSRGRYFSSAGDTTKFFTDSCPTSPCDLCAVGRYRSQCGEPLSEAASAGSCRPCPPGKFKAGYDAWYTRCTSCFRDCAHGQYRHGCSGDDAGRCMMCSNPKLQPGQYYQGTGGLWDSCPVGQCSSCPAGHYRHNCLNSSPGKCIACARGWFKADAGQWNSKCVDCRHASTCPSGYYRSGCGDSKGGVCIPCTNELPANHYYSGSGGVKNACPSKTCPPCPRGHGRLDCKGGARGTCVACPIGRFNSDSHSRACKACPAKGSCPPGFYRKGCGKDKSGVCTPCSNSVPKDFYYTSDGALKNLCPFHKCEACPPGEYRVGCAQTLHESQPPLGGACKKCAAGTFKAATGDFNTRCTSCFRDCAHGQYRHGCSGDDAGRCMMCSNPKLQPGQYYQGTGGLWDSCPVGQCSSCPAGHYRHNCLNSSPGKCIACARGWFKADAGQWNSKCVDCRHASTCPSGYYRSGCGDSKGGVCIPCTNELPANHYYSGSGGVKNSCPFKPCARCPLGHAPTGCGHNSAGRCTLCPNGRYRDSMQQIWCSECPSSSTCRPGLSIQGCGGSARGSCTSCVAGKYSRDHSCLDCSVRCPAGQYRHGCGGMSPGRCIACTQPVRREGQYYSGSGGFLDNCPVSECLACGPGTHRIDCGRAVAGTCRRCVEGKYKSSAGTWNTHCSSCTTPACPRGRYRAGCSNSNRGACVSCTNKLLANHYYSGNGGLANSCPSKRCGTCVDGYYRVNCGGENAGRCVFCTNKIPKGYYYSGSGGRSNSCPSDACPKCAKGHYRRGCGKRSRGYCTACSKPSSQYFFLGDGGTTDSCLFARTCSGPGLVGHHDKCSCATGYAGKPTLTGSTWDNPCQDIDECETNDQESKCGGASSCENGLAQFTCHCAPGYKVTRTCSHSLLNTFITFKLMRSTNPHSEVHALHVSTSASSLSAVLYSIPHVIRAEV